MDVGVIMHKSAKLSRQCFEEERKANLAVGTIRRKIVNRVMDAILRLYKSQLNIRSFYLCCASVYWKAYIRGLSVSYFSNQPRTRTDRHTDRHLHIWASRLGQ